MRKENLKRKGVEDGAENGSDNEEQEDSPVADAADKAEEDAEKQTANENTEENGDQKEPDTDGDFEDAETGDDTADEKKSKAKDKESAKEKENGNGDGDEKEEEGEGGDEDKAEDGEDDDVPLKKNGRAKPKPAKKGAKEATNGDSKENGDGKEDGEEGEGEKVEGDEAEDAEEADAGDDKEDADAVDEAGSKKGKKGKPGPKKDAKKTKPGPAKNAKKEKAENDDEEEKKEQEEKEEEEEEVEYEVQDIVDHRKQKGKMVYRIRWKNFKAKDDTWEPEATLSCPDIIKRYKAKLKKLEKEAREAEEEEEAEVEYEVQDIVDHRKERGKMVYRIRWKNFGAKDDTWEPESTLSCPDIIKRYKAKLAKEEEEDEEEQEYEVQEIIDHRKEKGKMVYRIRWKNFGPKDDTWEPESTLSCPDIIKRYKAKIAKEEEEDEEEEEYEVQEIIDHRKEKGKMVYRIRWKNFGPKDDTWEPESTLSCPDIIKRYKAKIEKEESAPPAKKYKPGPNLAALKKPGPNLAALKKPGPNLAALKKGKGKGKAQPPPKKRASRRDSSEEDDDESEDDTQYEVEKIIEVHFKRNGQREYLVRWKGFSAKDDTWEPEDNLSCKDLIAKFNEKLDKSKNAGVKELRVNRKQPDRLALVERGHKTSRRNAGKVRVNYYDGE